MKRTYFVAAACILLVCGAFSVADEILDKLGVRDPRYHVLNNMMNTYVNPSCTGGCQYFYIPRPTKLADVLTGDKKALARESCQWLKEYVESAAFNKDYQTKRLSAKPFNEQRVESDPEAIKSYTEMLENSRQMMKQARTAEEKANWSKTIKETEYGLARLKQPYPRTWEWEQKYPASTDSAIARALRYYLDESSSVDFNAALTQRGKVKIFSNPVYERKSSLWKAIYRAGKEVDTETRAFVATWLREGVHVSTEGYTAPATTQETASSVATDDATEKPVEKTEKTEKKKGGLLKKIKKVLD